jgi:hypothetical protein
MNPMMRVTMLRMLDGVRPSGALEWVSPVAPSVTQAVVGAGHWAAGRRRRALASWAGAAGYGLVAWGLGTESPTRAEADENLERHKERLRAAGVSVPATAAARPGLNQQSVHTLDAVGSSVRVVFGIRSGLRGPRRVTARAIADEAPTVLFFALRVPRAVQQRRLRIAVGSALIVVGAVARLRAASAEPIP